MPKRINYTLTDHELQEIEQTMKHDPRAEVVHRATAIRLFHQGHKAEEIAGMLSVSRASIQNWHVRWRNGGIEALADKPIPGRKPKANQTYREVLDKTLFSDPHELGYAFSVWTLDRLSQHLEQATGIRLSPGRLAEWMSRWGYVYRRPKQDLSHKQDAHVRQQVQQWLDELKKQPKRGTANSSLWTKAPSV
jgi:transposase